MRASFVVVLEGLVWCGALWDSGIVMGLWGIYVEWHVGSF